MRRLACRWLMLSLLMYVCSYLLLSRHVFREANTYGFKGLYFVLPTNETAYRIHVACVIVYAPLIILDNVMGTGRPLGREPLWGLEPVTRGRIGWAVIVVFTAAYEPLSLIASGFLFRIRTATASRSSNGWNPTIPKKAGPRGSIADPRTRRNKK